MGKGHKKKRTPPKTMWGKIWHFIWYDDSIWSWLANIVLAFVLIKFVIYPVLGLLFGTSLPVVAVISCSMDQGFTNCGEPSVPPTLCGSIEGPTSGDFWDHCGAFYEDRGITQTAFREFPLANGFDKGDVIVLSGVEPEDVEVGDVLVFQSNRPHPIIHRVIGVYEENGELFFETKGDHNPLQITDAGLDETAVPANAILGKGVARLRYLGYVKLLAVDAFSWLVP